MCGQGIAACLEDGGEGFNESYLDDFIRGKGKEEEEEEGFEGCFIPPNLVTPHFFSLSKLEEFQARGSAYI